MARHQVLALVNMRDKTFRNVRARKHDHFLFQSVGAAQDLQSHDVVSALAVHHVKLPSVLHQFPVE